MSDSPTYRSITLEKLETLPQTACVGCPNALWFIEHFQKEKREEVKVFCQLMHAVITNPMTSCDGTQVFPQQEKSVS